MSRIINQTPGQIPPSGQAPDPHRRQTCPTQGVRGSGGRDRSGGERGGGRRGALRDEAAGPPPMRIGFPRGDRARRGDGAGGRGGGYGRRGYGWRDPKGVNRRGDPSGGWLAPPWRKTRIYMTLTLNVRTCCCRKSMETFLTTTMGRTWTEESLTTLYGSVVGYRYPRNWLAGIPRPQEQWGTASWPF